MANDVATYSDGRQGTIDMTQGKVVVLSGGLGTRLREETEFRPKPMVNVGDKPLLWHITALDSAALTRKSFNERAVVAPDVEHCMRVQERYQARGQFVAVIEQQRAKHVLS